MRVNCIYHRDQAITNFCRDRNCLMPLCPSCIAEHTSYHEEDNSRPKYTSIFEAQSEVHAQITHCIESLESDKNRNGKLLISIQTVPDKVCEKIQIAKKMALDAVEAAFLTLESEVINKLNDLNESKDVYSVDKSHKMDKLILSHLDQLYALQDGLRGDRGLSNLIFFLREKQDEVNKFHSDVSSYLNVNQSYYPSIEINSEAFYSLNAIVSRAIKISAVERKPLVQSNIKKSRIAGRDSSAQKSVASKIRQHAPLVESQMMGYSPNRMTASPLKTRLKTRAKGGDKYDGEYENLSKKVLEMRQENERLSRFLNEQ